MDIHKLFDDKSDIYAQARPRYPQALYKWLAEQCPSHSAVWDVGCGSGQAALDLRGYFETVQATDVSPSQIENAPATAGVTFSVQPAESTNFADQTFDAVFVAQALHWFDHSKFWPEVMRVLKPNGVFAAWGYSWPHIDPETDQLLDESLLSVIRSHWAVQNQLLWDRYEGVASPFKPLPVPEFELIVSWSLKQFFAYLHSWSATRRCMDVQGDDFFENSYRQLSQQWAPEEIREVTMDFVVIAGINASPDSDGE